MSEAISSNKPTNRLLSFAVILTVFSCLLAFYVTNPMESNRFSLYRLFPLFGLLAFSIMWCHYVVAALNRTQSQPAQLDTYFRYTGYIVLACLLLHPGLLIYQLWSDWGTLPPNSYVQYVGEAGKMAVIFGSVSLVCFLLYETKYWLQKTRFWIYIIALSDIAMILIFVHGLRLGGGLQSGWYKYVWFFYGVTLVICIAQRLILPDKSKSTNTETLAN